MASVTQIRGLPGSESVQRGNQYLGNCQAIHAIATGQVQRGTKRPSGKRYRKRPKEIDPKDLRNATGSRQKGASAASTLIVSVKVAAPNVSSASETNSAMRSSGLRQKMRAATAPYAAAKPTSSATAYAAKNLGVRPRPCSAR